MSGISAGTSMLIAGGASSLTSAAGKIMSGQEQKSADDYNAQVTLDNMQSQMIANQEKTSERTGKQAADYSASGVDISKGSPLLVMAATAARGAQQGEQIEEAGTEQAAIQRYYGRIAAFSGTMSGIGSFLSGITATSSAYGRLTSNPTPNGGSSSSLDSAGDLSGLVG
jgi:hypothetical protein